MPETEHLRLRRVTPADAEAFFALDNDPDVMHWLNGGIKTPRSVFDVEIFPVFLRYDEEAPLLGFWALEEKTSGAFIGWVSYRPTEENPAEITLGFRLKKSAWGQGYAGEAARAILRKGFTEMGVERVVATTYEKNTASQRVLEKLGMKLAQKFRYTEEGLVNTATFHTENLDIWDGYDFKYAITKEDFST